MHQDLDCDRLRLGLIVFLVDYHPQVEYSSRGVFISPLNPSAAPDQPHLPIGTYMIHPKHFLGYRIIQQLLEVMRWTQLAPFGAVLLSPRLHDRT